MDPLQEADIRKQGILKKQGGGQGGHKTWKSRFFVLRDHLAYYTDQQTFASQPNKPLGVISLNNFFCAIVEGSNDHEFTIQAYPKNLNLRAASDDERDEWVNTLMEAEKTLDIPPYIRRRHQEEKENREREKLKATASSAAYETNPAKSKESS